MTPISVVILTLNEEKNIARCIDSVLELADDIVVVDSFSTDRTPEICAGYKQVRFIQHAFEGYIEQKNWAITQAKYPHILSLDADEAASDKLIKEIVRVKENWDADGYEMNRLTNYCGRWIKHCGWYPDRKLRLWDSRKGKWAGTNPHDKFEMEKGAIIKRLKGDIHHYSYYTIQQHIDQIQKFTDISAKMKFDKGKKISNTMVITRFFFVFIKKYFFKLGFLDGYYGFIICSLSSFYFLLKDVKLQQINEQQE